MLRTKAWPSAPSTGGCVETDITFTAWLKRKRREQGLTQETLAGLAGCSTTYLKKIEAGQRQPTRQIVEALLDALEVPNDSRPTYITLAFASSSPGSPRPTAPAAPPPPLIVGQTELVGRQGELAHMHQQWAKARQGRARVVLLSGEPGVGKTRLAHELMASVAQAGAAVLRGGCYEYEAMTPYLPFVEALRAYVRSQPAGSLRQRLGPTAPEIARLAPEIDAKIGPLAPNPTLAPNDERLRLFDNIARFLATLAGDIGLLLFLDDLHWADQATIALLRYLLRNLPNERLLVLATYRDDEMDRTHPLADALLAWHREHIATRLTLGRLSEAETAAMLATLFEQDSVSAEFAEAIYHETEGNPFFTEEVVKSLIEQGQVYREGEGWGRRAVAELAIPTSIKEVIGRRLAHLSQTCIETLHAAATLGKTFGFGELAAVSTMDEDALLDALDEASAAQLIRPEGADSFVFTHDKIRETLVEELNPLRRRRLHQRVGEGLEKLYAAELDGHAADLAYHFVAGHDWRRGLAYSLRAADSAARLFGHDEALKYLAMARECSISLDDRAGEAAVAERLGDIYAMRGPAATAIEHYTAALAMVEDVTKRAVLKARIGAVYSEIGDMRGEEFFQEAARELDPETQPGELARALAHLGRFQHHRGQLRRAIELLEQAYAIAQPLDDPATLRTIFSHFAGAYEHLVRCRESMEWARRSIRLGQQRDFPFATQMGVAYLAENALITGDWPAALDYIAQERALAQKIGALGAWDWTAFYHAWRLHSLGHLTEARAMCRKAYDMAHRADDVRGTAVFAARLAEIETDLGLDESARVYVDEAVTAARASSTIRAQCLSLWAAAYFHVQREEWAESAALLDEAVTRVAGTDHRLGPLEFGSTHAEAYLGLGRVADAARINDEHLILAREAEAHHCEALALRVRGQIRAAQESPDEAEDAYAAAISIFERSGARLELGRALYHRACLRLDLGQPDDARADLARARDLFAACGAPRDLRRAEALLAHVPPR